MEQIEIVFDIKKVQTVDVERVQPNPWNPKGLDTNEYQRVVLSLRKKGLRQPIVVREIDDHFQIIDGEQRWRGWKELGKHEILIYNEGADISDQEAKELTIAYQQQVPFIEVEFAELLKDMTDQYDSLELPIEDEEIKDLIASLDFLSLGNITEDEPPEVEDGPTITQEGDLWYLDKHRVLCGDSTKTEDVERVMDGGKADMVFTDPPYGVNYEGGTFNPVQREKLAGDDGNIYEHFVPLLADYCNGPIYLWYADILGGRVFRALSESAIVIHAQIVWHKTNAKYAAWNANYKQRHEVCMYCKPKGATLRWCGATDEATVWELKRDASNNYHPTQKPLSLAARAIGNHEAKTVLDFFLGSGATLIAADQLDRICYGLEISKKYCDVIVQRYINHVDSSENVYVERDGEKLSWEEVNG